jgi:hypothetical protein
MSPGMNVRPKILRRQEAQETTSQEANTQKGNKREIPRLGTWKPKTTTGILLSSLMFKKLLPS